MSTFLFPLIVSVLRDARRREVQAGRHLHRRRGRRLLVSYTNQYDDFTSHRLSDRPSLSFSVQHDLVARRSQIRGCRSRYVPAPPSASKLSYVLTSSIPLIHARSRRSGLSVGPSLVQKARRALDGPSDALLPSSIIRRTRTVLEPVCTQPTEHVLSNLFFRPSQLARSIQPVHPRPPTPSRRHLLLSLPLPRPRRPLLARLLPQRSPRLHGRHLPRLPRRRPQL